MTLQALLDQKGISKYSLSQKSGIPKSTIHDICSGKSSIERCSAKTVLLLATALKCTMEDIMKLDIEEEYEVETGLPKDKSYLECSLPQYLSESVENMKVAWEKEKLGEKYMHFDADYCTLQSDINCAEVSNSISSEQAWYLREKYLGLERIG